VARLIRFRLAGLARTAAGAGVLALCGVIAGAGTASAASTITAKYPVTGSTFLKAPNFTMKLGPGTLTATASLSTGKITANLSLPPATGSFKQFGLIPVTATTQFINDGPTTGSVNLTTGAVHTTSHITLHIVSLSVSGLNVPVGNSCETSTPVTVKVASAPGFNVLAGGTLKGTYTIPQFASCGLATLLINSTIPGPGNTIRLTLGTPTAG
jgi:hypothetical protein